MERIEITISDKLTKEQEVFAIAKKLSKQLKIGKKQKQIGDNLEIKHLKTAITINRVSTERTYKTIDCSCCGSSFIKAKAKVLYTNYGGATRRLLYCSDECKENVYAIIGGNRVTKTRIGAAHLF